MSRVASAQTNLFAPARPDPFAPSVSEVPTPSIEPVDELKALLDKVQRASQLPWADAAEAMVEEQRALWLAQQAGDEGARLAAAIFDETERLFSAGE